RGPAAPPARRASTTGSKGLRRTGRDERRDEVARPLACGQSTATGARKAAMLTGMKPIFDALYRVALLLAYRAALCWWFIARRPHFGAVTAVWHDGKLLLVRDSYRRMWSLPGGGIGSGEAPADAAVRELREETGVVVEPGALSLAGIFDNVW